MKFESLTNTKLAKSSTQGKTPIWVSVNVLSIVSVLEVEKIFRVNYKLTMKWRDTRLRFFNLKKESYLNILSLNESLSIWYPIAVFQNTLNSDKSKVNGDIHNRMHVIFYTSFQLDSESISIITRSGNFSISPREKLHNDHIFSGKDNSISTTRTYTTDFDCKFDMHFYPFDIQQCNMNLILGVSLYLKL